MPDLHWKILLASLALLAGAALWPSEGLCGGTAYAQSISSSDDWCYQAQVEVFNGGAEKSDYPVRFEADCSTWVSDDRMDPFAQDVRAVKSQSDGPQLDVLAQDLETDDCTWWLRVPSIGANETQKYSVLLGNDAHQRDQGWHGSGSASLTAPHNAAYDITSDLKAAVHLDLRSEDAQDATLISHHDSGTGWSLELSDAGGTLTILGRGDGGTVSTAWNSAWTDDEVWVELRHDGSDLSIHVDGSQIATTSTGTETVSAVSTGLVIADSLSDAIVREARVEDTGASTEAGVWGFDPRSELTVDSGLSETSASNPTYQGTAADYSGTSNDASYTITADQSDFEVTTSDIQSSTFSFGGSEPGGPVDVVGRNIFGPVVIIALLGLMGAAMTQAVAQARQRLVSGAAQGTGLSPLLPAATVIGALILVALAALLIPVIVDALVEAQLPAPVE